jgi:hypothetical protein
MHAVVSVHQFVKIITKYCLLTTKSPTKLKKNPVFCETKISQSQQKEYPGSHSE